MSLLSLILVLVIIGFVLYLVNQLIPLDPQIKKILNVAVVIFLVIWLIQSLGLLGPLATIRIR